MIVSYILSTFLLFDGNPSPAKFLPREGMTSFAVTDKLEQAFFATGFL